MDPKEPLKPADEQMASRIHLEDFAGGTVDKNPPASAGHPGSAPALGRLHTLQSNLAQVPQLLKPHAWSLCFTREASAMRSPHTATKSQPAYHSYRKATCSNGDPAQPKIYK